MKRVFLLLFCLLLLVCSVAAAAPRYVFADLGQHGDILSGFFPSYLLNGVGYKLHDVKKGGNTTDFQVLVGEGYLQRLLWQDPATGSSRFISDGGDWTLDEALRYNVWTNELSLRFIQGFGQSPVVGKDLLTLIAYVNTRYEKYYGASSPLFLNIRGNVNEVLDDYRVDGKYDGSVYPELAGANNQFLGTELALSLKYDCMEDTLHTNDGYFVRVMAKYGPKFLNNFSGDGFADYFTVTGNLVTAKTLYNLTGDNGRSLLSVVLVDRANMSYTTGDAVPMFIQGDVSLGRKVRGYNTWTYNTEFTSVNNFDVRIAGPGLGLDQIAPRLNIFVDCGYGWGQMFNEKADKEYSNFLASTGFQIELSMFDMFDLGFEVNYLLTPGKEKYTEAGRRITTNATFFLDM